VIRLRGLLRRSRGEAGYSLIEMLTVLLIMGIVMEALTTVFVRASTAEADMNNRFRSQQNARLALDKMRREIHCADTVTKGTSTTPSGPLAAYYINITLSSGCATNKTGAPLTVTWCTQGSGSRWGIYRVSGSSTCTGGTRYADYLTKPNVFDYTAPTSGSGILPKINIDLPVNVAPRKGLDLYEVKDDIVLRNGTRG
jgi:prepilin-type N-terminal cleavage/methylation domain-containing protein